MLSLKRRSSWRKLSRRYVLGSPCRLNALTAPLLCMYVCTYVCMYVQCLFFLYFNNCEHVHMHMYVRRYLNLDRQSVNWSWAKPGMTREVRKQRSPQKRWCVCMCLHLYMHVCTFLCMYVCTHACVHTYVCTLLLRSSCHAVAGCSALWLGKTKERFWYWEGEGGYLTWGEVGLGLTQVCACMHTLVLCCVCTSCVVLFTSCVYNVSCILHLLKCICVCFIRTDVSRYMCTSFVNGAIESVVLPSLQGHPWAAVAAPCGWVEEPAWDSQQPVEGEEQEHEVSLLQAPHVSPSPPACA